MFILISIFTSCNNQNHTKNYLSNKKIKNQPNILFILLDDLGKEWVSCYVADDIKTPNIDSLLMVACNSLIHGQCLNALPQE